MIYELQVRLSYLIAEEADSPEDAIAKWQSRGPRDLDELTAEGKLVLELLHPKKKAGYIPEVLNRGGLA